jgi:hypothetical protein
MNPDRLDLDPRPRNSPSLYAEVGAIPRARPVTSLRRLKPNDALLARLRRDLAIYLAIEGGMSQRTAGKAFGLSQPGILKAYRRMSCRKSRV